MALHLRLINTLCEDWNNTYVWSTHDAKTGSITSIWSTHDAKIDTALTSDQHMMWRMALHLRLINTWCEDWHSTYVWSTHDAKTGSALTSTQTGTHPITVMEGHALTSDLVVNYNHIRMAPSPPRLSYLVTDQEPPFSSRMAVTLTSDLLVEMANTHIWHGRN